MVPDTFSPPGVQRVRIPLDRATPPNPSGAFVCEVVGRALGPGGWALACFDGPDADARVHFGVRVMHGGRLKIIRNNLGDAETTELSDTAVVSHDAIKKGGDPYNALQLLVRHRDLEVYVNGVAVCDPVLLDRDVAAPYLALVAWGGGRRPLTVEYQRVTVWPAESIPPLDQRGAVPKGR